MVLNEHELRQYLTAAADHASAPRFTTDDLISRIRRRRAKFAGLVSGSLLAVAAIAVAVPVALSGPSAPSAATAPTSHPQDARSRLSFTVAVNGQVGARPKNAPPASFTVAPGETLRIHVGVIAQTDAKVTTLWLGVANGAFGSPGPDGQRPAGLRPILLHTGKRLTPGLHTFKLRWTVPAQLPRGTILWLVAAWAQQDASVGQPIAELVTPH